MALTAEELREEFDKLEEAVRKLKEIFLEMKDPSQIIIDEERKPGPQVGSGGACMDMVWPGDCPVTASDFYWTLGKIEQWAQALKGVFWGMDPARKLNE